MFWLRIYFLPAGAGGMDAPDLATKSSKFFGTARFWIIHLRTARLSSVKSGSPATGAGAAAGLLTGAAVETAA